MDTLNGLSPVELGVRLKAARSMARLTQEQASQAIGVARTTLVAIEAGERPIKAAELTKLAEVYGVSVNSLVRRTAVHVDLVPQFRRSSSAREDESASIEAARLLQKCASFSVELEGFLGKRWSSVSFPQYRIAKNGWQEQAEDLAAEIRQRLGVGSGPIADIFVLVEVDMGIRLFIQEISSRISGLFAYHESLGACILLNSLHPVERRVWTCAHEVGHFLTNRESADVDWIDSKERSLDERFADRFAAAFLMPASMLRIRYADIAEAAGKFSPKSLVFLARSFNVSIEAMARRLEQLSLLPSGTYDSLVDRGFSAKRAGELFGLDPKSGESFVPRLTWLVLEAYQKEFLTEGQVGEALGLDRVRVRRMVESLMADSFDTGEGEGDVSA